MEMSLGSLRQAEEWIDFLVDPQSFVPLLSPTEGEAGFGDEIITGFAKVQGRPIALWACRPDIRQGYISSQGAIKIRRLMDRAYELGIPLVSFLSSAGISVDEGVKSGEEYSRVMMATAELSGQIPQIACVMGANIGAPAYSAALQDLVLFNRTRSYLCVSGPGVVKQMLGENATYASLGGFALHAHQTGLANFVDANAENQLRRCKWLLSFLPPNYKDDPDVLEAVSPKQAFPEIPMDPQVPFDMNLLIQGLVDGSEFMEYNNAYGPSALCGFARIGGFPVGVAANQSLAMSGALDVNASKKMARFIRICDSYNIPILTLIDAPGFMPGTNEEKNGILKAGADLIYAMKTRAPKLSVVVRKCYGAAAIVLCATRNWRGDLVLALPSAHSAVMGFDAVKDIIYKNDSRSVEEQKKDYFENQENPAHSLRMGLVDEIIEGKNLRERLIQHLELLRLKRPMAESPVRDIGP